MEKGILYNKDKTRILICSRDKQEESYQIPSTVEKIDPSAFLYCDKIKSIILPESISKIERSTFNKCTALENINIPNSVTEIGEGAFYSDKSLREIIIPKSVTGIGKGAFAECEFEKIYIPSKHENYAKENNIAYEIDDTSPEINRIEGNITDKTSENVVLKVIASDNQSGLALRAYSFDNGETWQESNEKTYSENTQGITIKVRDNIGNETTYEEKININNIEKRIKELKIKQMPNKLEYIQGESLDLTGIVLEVEYEDGTKEEITEGFTVDKEILDTLGSVTITINYENVSTSFSVNVGEKQEDKQDEGKQDEGKQDEGKQDEGKQDEGKQDEGKQDEGKQDEGKQDEGKQDEGKQDESKQDEGKQDEGKQDESKQDESKQDEGKQDETKKSSTEKTNNGYVTNKVKEDPDTANENNAAKNTSTYLSNNKLPYTGLIRKVMPICIIITISVAIITYIGYIKYRN